MRLRSLISPIALAAALAFSSGAMAQSSIGGMDIPEEDLPEVQALCTSLAAAGNESLTAESDPDDGAEADASADDGAADPDPAAENGEPSDMDNALTTIDLETITLEQCQEAGLVQ